MNDALITVVGYVAAEPHFEILASGTSLMSLRVGSTPRRYDRDLGRWRDDDPMFLTATCWRTLADNLRGCDLKRGDPIIVTGKLRIREYVKGAERRFSAQIEATTVGHDLSRGVARFQRVQRGAAGLTEDRRLADDVADRWLNSDDERDPADLRDAAEDPTAGPAGPTAAADADGATSVADGGEAAETDDSFDQDDYRAVA